MKIRPIRPLSEYDGNIPARQAAAEQRFLRALQREARGSQKPAPVSVPRRATVPMATNRPHAQGQAAGAAFAQITRNDYDRATTFARAIQAGVRTAEREAQEAREIAQNAGALRAMGFPSSDDEDDNDF
jgi:hypothetical protein